MLFLTDVDHVSFEKANETRQNNLQSATVSLQVVIGLCKRKETAALKSKPPFQMGVSNCLLYDGFFSFAVVRQSLLLNYATSTRTGKRLFLLQLAGSFKEIAYTVLICNG